MCEDRSELYYRGTNGSAVEMLIKNNNTPKSKGDPNKLREKLNLKSSRPKWIKNV